MTIIDFYLFNLTDQTDMCNHFKKMPDYDLKYDDCT